MDFEIATRIPLSLRGPDSATEHMRERAALMSDVSKALFRGLGIKQKHQIIHCRFIQAFRSSERAGLRFRPALIQPEAVCLELARQVMLHAQLMGERSTQWKWRPNQRFLPHILHQPIYLSYRLWLRRRIRVRGKSFSHKATK